MIILKDGKPFEGSPNMNPDKIKEAVRLGALDEAELKDRGLDICAEFVDPAGKDRTGEPRYIQSKNGWVEEYDVVDRKPVREPTPQEKFEAATGVTIQELKELLA